MRDAPINQAVGLLGLAAPESPQLLAVVAHGDARSEQPLLWQLSSALTELGYGVTVLDATVNESDRNPGLQQLLDYEFGHGPEGVDSPNWNVLPAALGLQSLCRLGTRPVQSLERLGQTFQTNGIIVLYAGVDYLVKLLPDSDIRPLLSVSSGKSSLLTSYLALKRLLRKARLQPTILNMMEQNKEGPGNSAVGVAHALGECAKNFLAYEVTTIRIDPSQTESQFNVEMRHLATRLLENALDLKKPARPHRSAATSGYRELSRSH